MPADLSWTLTYGNTSCYAARATQPTCTDIPFPAPQTCPTNSLTGSDNSGSPYKCFTYKGNQPVYYQFGSLKADAPGKAYQFQVFPNLECTGFPIGYINPVEYGKCKEMVTQGVGVKVVPMWNADSW